VIHRVAESNAEIANIWVSNCYNYNYPKHTYYNVLLFNILINGAMRRGGSKRWKEKMLGAAKQQQLDLERAGTLDRVTVPPVQH